MLVPPRSICTYKLPKCLLTPPFGCDAARTLIAKVRSTEIHSLKLWGLQLSAGSRGTALGRTENNAGAERLDWMKFHQFSKGIVQIGRTSLPVPGSIIFNPSRLCQGSAVKLPALKFTN